MTKAARAPDPSLSLPTILAFSATSMPIAALVVAITVHLPAYFAASIGVPVASADAFSAQGCAEADVVFHASASA